MLRRKKYQKLRFCVDFRRLNALVELDGFALPKIPEMISLLGRYRWFTTIDLKDGFFQIPIRKGDREKTTFSTGTRLMRFTRMPQGYKNSPGVFQRAMTLVLQGLLEKACVVYIDDILIYGETESEHDDNVRKVEERLAMYKLEENKEKRCFKQREVTFVGYVIGEGRVKPVTSRAEGIINYKAPRTRKEVQRFLGLINYDRMFIRGMSEKLVTFYQLLEKDHPFKWTEEHAVTFENVKSEWVKHLELRLPDMSERFTLEADASATGIGAVLKQKEEAVAYISRTLSKAEKNYGITEREVLAALWAMEKFQYYLLGREFDLITDHQAITEIRRKPEFGSMRVQRWIERLERFEFTVKYRKGEEMVAADALSRAVEPPVEEGEGLDDEMVEKVLEIHKRTGHRKNIREHLTRERIQITEKALRKTLKKCVVCARKDKKYGKSVHFVETQQPGERVGIDLMEISKKERIIVLIDYFTRKVFAKVVSTKEAEKIETFLEEVYQHLKFGSIISDNGREFSNNKVEEWCKVKGVKQLFAIPYYHESNGRVERAIKTIREAVKRVSGCLKTKLVGIVEAYNNSVHRGTGMCPDEAIREENWKKVREWQIKYRKEIEQRKAKVGEFKMGQEVLIRNEFKRTKMDDEFKSKGKIVEVRHGDTYKVKTSEGVEILRHALQLREV